MFVDVLLFDHAFYGLVPLLEGLRFFKFPGRDGLCDPLLDIFEYFFILAEEKIFQFLDDFPVLCFVNIQRARAGAFACGNGSRGTVAGWIGPFAADGETRTSEVEAREAGQCPSCPTPRSVSSREKGEHSLPFAGGGPG